MKQQINSKGNKKGFSFWGIIDQCRLKRNDQKDDQNLKYQKSQQNHLENEKIYQQDKQQINQKKNQEESENENIYIEDKLINIQNQDEENQIQCNSNQNSNKNGNMNQEQNIQGIKSDQNTINNSYRNYSDNIRDQNKQYNQKQAQIENQQQQQLHLEAMKRSDPSVLQPSRELQNNQIQNIQNSKIQIIQNNNQQFAQKNKQQLQYSNKVQQNIKNQEDYNYLQNTSIRIKQNDSLIQSNYESNQNRNQQSDLHQFQVSNKQNYSNIIQNNPKINCILDQEKANYKQDYIFISSQNYYEQIPQQKNMQVFKQSETNQQNQSQSRISLNSQESNLNDNDSLPSKVKTIQVRCFYCQNEIYQKYTQLQCQHFYCNDCLKELLRNQSLQKDRIRYQCNCSKTINLQLFIFERDKIINLLNEKLNINQINILQQQIKKQKTVKNCRNKHCQFFVIMRDDLNKEYFYCPLCLEKQYDDQQKK
ncbi:unnamed protein product [Paramecium sonneborni]|uniref:RING-type domain-containing protein n=1 Tax=Paramecium sonneborni TaxID=65129 RepID=A0A8S1MUZ9_9CILI|nr:unnamed protein product [Paramecium sonneborni]